MQIIQAFVTQNKCYQAGVPLTPRGIMLHSVGTPQPSARALVRYMDQYQPGGQSVCVHAVAQADGTVYQHILDPKTGCPVQSDLLSVTIVSDSGTLADACSTALYVMGEQEAVNFWRQTGGFEMVLITADGRLLYTPGLAEKITTPEEGRYAAAAIDA